MGLNGQNRVLCPVFIMHTDTSGGWKNRTEKHDEARLRRMMDKARNCSQKSFFWRG
jgi:hypothetical protein